MSEEQRVHQRFELNRPLTVRNAITQDLLGTVVNLSRDGLMLLGSVQVHDSGVYQVEIPLSNQGAQPIVLVMGIECLWVNGGERDEKIWSGFKVIDIDDNNQHLLDECIKSLR